MIRLRVPVAIAVLAGLTLAAIWLGDDSNAQVRASLTLATLFLSFITLLAWFVLFSGAPGRVRAGVAVTVAALVGVFGASFRVRGFTGNMVPILEFRFAARKPLPEARVAAIPPPAPVDPAPIAAPAPAAAAGASPGGTAVPAPVEPKPPSHAAWPQYLGPARSGVIGTNLASDWEKNPPRLLWRQSVGAGWAGFAVLSDIAVTLEQRGDEERVIAYELRTGRPLWSHADRTRHASPLGSEGPRSVPAIDGGQVFALGATGTLNALDLRTGRLLWSRNILKDNSGAEPEWGVAVSPLLRGNRVIVSAGAGSGRALVAYDRGTGEPVWAAGDGRLAYSSPVLMTLAGREQVVMLNKSTVAGHDAETGAVLWEQEFPHEQPNVAQPIPLSANRVLFSVGYGIGSRVFEISQSGEALSAKLVWATPRLKSKFANMVVHRGSIYGLDDGVFVCIDPATGERRWKAGRYGHGQLILAGDRLLVQTEEGEVVMIDPNPERLIEVARFSALSGKTWNPPALAAPILLVRNDLEAAAWELPVRR